MMCLGGLVDGANATQVLLRRQIIGLFNAKDFIVWIEWRGEIEECRGGAGARERRVRCERLVIAGS